MIRFKFSRLKSRSLYTVVYVSMAWNPFHLRVDIEPQLFQGALSHCCLRLGCSEACVLLRPQPCSWKWDHSRREYTLPMLTHLEKLGLWITIKKYPSSHLGFALLNPSSKELYEGALWRCSKHGVHQCRQPWEWAGREESTEMACLLRGGSSRDGRTSLYKYLCCL